MLFAYFSHVITCKAMMSVSFHCAFTSFVMISCFMMFCCIVMMLCSFFMMLCSFSVILNSFGGSVRCGRKTSPPQCDASGDGCRVPEITRSLASMATATVTIASPAHRFQARGSPKGSVSEANDSGSLHDVGWSVSKRPHRLEHVQGRCEALACPALPRRPMSARRRRREADRPNLRSSSPAELLRRAGRPATGCRFKKSLNNLGLVRLTR